MTSTQGLAGAPAPGGMERSFSVDDIVGGIWRLGAAGMGRTDSEAAFQEFLKKIPSNTNLAAAAQSQDAATQQLQLQQQALLQQQAQMQAAYQEQAAAAAAGGVPGTGGGIPRVPSLDLLRQQLQQLQAFQLQNLVQPTNTVTPTPGAGATAATTPGGTAGQLRAPTVSAGSLVTGVLDPSQASSGFSLPTVSLQLSTPTTTTPAGMSGLSLPLTSMVPSLPIGLPGLSGATQIPGLTASALQGPNAAALLQMGQLQQAQQAQAALAAATAGGDADKESQEKQELRRARRMLSNRESARRSRKRKQEHLNKLESEKSQLAELKEETDKALNAKQAKMDVMDEELQRTRQENASLKLELTKLKAELEALKGAKSESSAPPKAAEQAEATPTLKSSKSNSDISPNGCAAEKAKGSDIPAAQSTVAV